MSIFWCISDHRKRLSFSTDANSVTCLDGNSHRLWHCSSMWSSAQNRLHWCCLLNNKIRSFAYEILLTVELSCVHPWQPVSRIFTSSDGKGTFLGAIFLSNWVCEVLGFVSRYVGILVIHCWIMSRHLRLLIYVEAYYARGDWVAWSIVRQLML